MITEMDVLEALKKTIITSLPSFDDKNTLLDYPEPDSMRKDSMIYIVPDYAHYEDLTTLSDEVNLNATLFILTKGARSDVLIKRVFEHFSALYQLLRGDKTLGGVIEDSSITDMDYYPALSSSTSMVAIEVKILLSWQRNTQRR